MNNSNETKKTSKKTLKDLKEYLEVKFKPDPMEIKPDTMTDKEMKDFYEQKIIPVFEKLEKQLSEFNFESLGFNVHKRIVTFKVLEILSQLYFKVDIDNGKRQVKIYYELKYRYAKKKKLTEIINDETVNISFNNIDTINEEMLISLFIKWYMNKDEIIQQNKEMIKNKSSESKNNENNSTENVNDDEVKQ